MQHLILLISSLLFTQASLACDCTSQISKLFSLMPGQAVPAAVVKAAADQAMSTEEILRVKVMALSTIEGRTTYKVAVLETLKSNRKAAVVRTLTTGPDSCRLNMLLEEEWLLFVNAERVMQCDEDALLSNAAKERYSGLGEAARANAAYTKASFEWLKLVRSALTERRK